MTSDSLTSSSIGRVWRETHPHEDSRNGEVLVALEKYLLEEPPIPTGPDGHCKEAVPTERLV